MAGMVPGRAIPIRYNPDDRTRAVWDDHPDESLAQERAARYQCRKHLDDLSYEQRMELLKNGVMKKALLKSFRLTGKEEAGDYEAEAAIQLAGEEQSGHTFERTLYVPQYGFGIPDSRAVCGRASHPGQGKSLCFCTGYLRGVRHQLRGIRRPFDTEKGVDRFVENVWSLFSTGWLKIRFGPP